MSQRWSYLLLLVSGVNLIHALEFLHSKQTYVVDRGSSLDINCNVNDNAAEVFLWHKFSHETRAYEIPVDDVKLSQQGKDFTLLDIGYHDNGMYECVAVSRDGNRAVHVIADVKVKPNHPMLLHNGTQLYNLKYDALTSIKGSKPFIIFDFKSPYQVSVQQTKELRLGFKLKGLRPIRTRWMKDNKEIKEDLGIKPSDTALIVLPPFYTNHSGNYELEACNSQGCTLRGLQILFYVPKEKKDQSQEPIIKWTHAAIALSSITIVAIAVTLIMLKKMGLIFKSTKQRLEEEAKKTKEQFRRGRNSRSGSIWNYTAIPVDDESIRQNLHHNNETFSTVAPAIPQTPRPTTNDRVFYGNIGDFEKRTHAADNHGNAEEIYEDLDDIKRTVVKNPGDAEGIYEDMNDLNDTTVGDDNSEDIYQNMEDIKMYQTYDTKKEEDTIGSSGNDEDIYQNFYDVKTTFEDFENDDYRYQNNSIENSGNDEDIYQNFYDVSETLEDYQES